MKDPFIIWLMGIYYLICICNRDLYFFLFDPFQIFRAEIKKSFRSFWRQMRTRKFVSEIYWPLILTISRIFFPNVGFAFLAKFTSTQYHLMNWPPFRELFTLFYFGLFQDWTLPTSKMDIFTIQNTIQKIVFPLEVSNELVTMS